MQQCTSRIRDESLFSLLVFIDLSTFVSEVYLCSLLDILPIWGDSEEAMIERFCVLVIACWTSVTSVGWCA